MAKLQYLTPQDLGIEDYPTFAGLSINGPIDPIDYIQFNIDVVPPDHSKGIIAWNDADKTLDLHTDVPDVKLQIGQEMFIRVVNKSGVTLTNGQLVYVSGAQGQRPIGTLASATNAHEAHSTIGMVTADILNNQEGYITTHGLVRDINTTGISEGGIVYLSNITGNYVNTAPDAPSHETIIGYCIYEHENNGIIFIKVHNGAEISDLHDAQLTDAQNGDMLYYDAPNYVWRNISSRDMLNALHPSRTITTDSTSVVTDYLILVDTTSGDVTITLSDGSSSSGQVLHIKLIDATNKLTIDGNGYTIDGQNTIESYLKYDSYQLYCNGIEWFIL